MRIAPKDSEKVWVCGSKDQSRPKSPRIENPYGLLIRVDFPVPCLNASHTSTHPCLFGF